VHVTCGKLYIVSSQGAVSTFETYFIVLVLDFTFNFISNGLLALVIDPRRSAKSHSFNTIDTFAHITAYSNEAFIISHKRKIYCQ